MHTRISIPESFPAAVTDRFVSAFFSPKSDIMLQMELTFDHRLDTDTLRKALDSALDAEPILGCRFTIEDGQAVWERLHNDERGNFLEFSREDECRDYKKKTLDAQRGPALQGAVLHEAAGDRILLKIAHEAADAGGAKDVAYLVASLYRSLKKDPSFMPSPNLTGSGLIRELLDSPLSVDCIGYLWHNSMRSVKQCLPRNVCQGAPRFGNRPERGKDGTCRTKLSGDRSLPGHRHLDTSGLFRHSAFRGRFPLREG